MKRFLMVVLLLLLGCSHEYEESTEAKAVLEKDRDAAGAVVAVREYNRHLLQAYAKGDAAEVRELTAPAELNKLAHMIDGMQAQKLRLEGTLQGLKVEKVERWGENNVLVVTTEKWRYRRVNTDSGAVVKPPTDIEYHMNYNMIRPKGKWILSQLTPA